MPQGVFPDEKDGLLLADSVEEFRNIRLLDGGAFVIGCLFGKLARRACDGGAVAACRAAQGLFSGRVGAFLGVKFERSAFVNSCDAPMERFEAAQRS